MSVAIVHDAFVQHGGGERVAAELVRTFEGAPLYAAALQPEYLPEPLRHEDVRTTFVQQLVGRGVSLRVVAPFLPAAFASIDVGPATVVLSSSSAFAHHVRVPRHAVHVCYCHTPPRFLWDADDYFRSQGTGRAATWPGRAVFRRIDRAASRRVDLYVANSRYIAERIRRVYDREAIVVYPPVNAALFEPSTERSGRFLVVSRLRNQKRIDLAIEAANRTGFGLDVIGDGPERRHLERLAGPTVRILGRRDDGEVRHAMARSAGVLIPAVADFGLTIVEAQASGRPPIAFAGGGALESIDDGRTGFLFVEQTPEGVADAMRRALRTELSSNVLVSSARRFDVTAFQTGIRVAVALAVDRQVARERGHPDSELSPAALGAASSAKWPDGRHGV